MYKSKYFVDEGYEFFKLGHAPFNFPKNIQMKTKILEMVKMFPNTYENEVAGKIGEIIEVNGRHYPSDRFNKVVEKLCASGKISRTYTKYGDIYPEQSYTKVKIPVLSVI